MGDNIYNYVDPVDETDAAAMIHDVNYILANGDANLLRAADTKANARAKGLDALVMQLGLSIRDKLGLYKDLPTNVSEGYDLKYKLLNDPHWAKYHITNNDFV